MQQNSFHQYHLIIYCLIIITNTLTCELAEWSLFNFFTYCWIVQAIAMLGI